MRWFMTIVAWLLSTAVLVPVCFFVALVLAGPHSSLLPSVLQPVVLIICWAVVLVGPVMVARVAWRRAG